MARAKKIVTTLAAVAAAFSPAVADVGKLHQMNSIHYPDFKSCGWQDSVKRKLERYYGKGDYTYNKELVDKVDACAKWCERLLGLITYDKVVSVAKNHWNITDRQASSGKGAGARSSAFGAKRTSHHIARGAAVEAPHVAEAAEVTGPGTESEKLSSRSLVSKSEWREAVSSEATASLQPASAFSFS